MELVSRGYLFYYVIERHLFGFVTEGQEHGDVAWYYYLGPVLGGSMPWVLYAAAAVVQASHDRLRTFNRATLLLVCWLCGGFLFLSVAGSKLLTYALPLFPPIAVLAGLGFRQFFHKEVMPLANMMIVIAFRLSSAFGIVSPVIALLTIDHIWGINSPPAAYVVAVIASSIMGAAFVLFERGFRRPAFAIGVLWFPLSFAFLMTWPVQAIAEQYSQRSLAHVVRSAIRPDELLIVGERIGSVIFYLSPSERNWLREGRAREASVREVSNILPIPPDKFVAVSDGKIHGFDCSNEILRSGPVRAGKFYVIASPPKLPMVAQRDHLENK
jgi:hypothetical protein